MENCNLNHISPKQYQALKDGLNRRLEGIYRELCEYEEILNRQSDEDDPLKLFELLESVNEISSTAKSLPPIVESVSKQHEEVCAQMELLERSVELLTLEKKIKSVEIMIE